MESSIFEHVPVGLYRTTADGQILNANPALATILGFPSIQACLAANVLDLYVDPADRETWLSDLVTPGAVARAEFRLRRPDGTMIWVRDTCRLTRAVSGQVRYEGMLEDITAQRAAAEQLRESEARFRAVFEFSPVGKCLVAPDGRFLAVSPAFCRLLGYDAEELVGRRFAEVTHPDDVAGSVAWVQALLAGRETSSQFEKRYLHRSGRIIWGIVSTSLLRHANGTPHLFVTEVFDTTAQKLAEEARQRSEDRYRSLIAALGDGVVLQDADAGIVAANASAERLLGLSLQELSGRTWDDPVLCLVDDDRRPVSPTGHPALITLRTGEPQTDVTVGIARPERDPTWVLLNTRPLIRPGATVPYAVMTTIHDITERRQLAAQFEQAQKMEAIGRLAGGVAHDFNNVLTAVLGYGEMVLTSLAGDRRADDVREILRAGEAAKVLTQQLLAFSRRQTLEPQPLNLNDIVRTTVRLLSRLVGEDIQIVQQLDTELGVVRADLGQIQQVLMNLAVNARDAMPTGGTLTIETANVDLNETYAALRPGVTPGPHIMLAMADTGQGMTADVQAHIFEPFFTTKARGVGTGLGLSTVYGIVKQSGGHIWVYSEVGRGTMFRMYFPVVSEAPEVRIPIAEPSTERGGSETVLIVEDNKQVLSLARLTLQSYGYTTLTATDGHEALAASEAHSGPIHLLFSDVVLPGPSGPDVFKALLSTRPELRAVFTSGYAHGMTVHHLGIGASTFLRKPYSPAALASTVRAALDHVSATEDATP